MLFPAETACFAIHNYKEIQMFKLLDELRSYKPYDNQEQEDLTKIIFCSILMTVLKCY